MSEDESKRDSIRAKISGDVSGQVAVGKNIRQAQSVGAPRTPLTEVELTQLRQLLTDLRAQVEAGAPPDKMDAAVERVNELEEAVMAKKPDLSTMEYVRNWFGRNAPKLAGAITAVLVHPLVGKAVEAGGELVSDEFRRRFGNAPGGATT